MSIGVGFVRFILSVSLILNVSCSGNILETFADKTSNEALYAAAKILINEGDYNAALAKIALMEGAYVGRREVVSLKASAYAGLCGLRFLPFVMDLQNIGTARVMPLLLSHFVGGTTSRIDNCVLAEDTLATIGGITARTNDENLFMATIGLAKVGAVMSLYADANQDGLVTVGFDACDSSGVVRAAGAWVESDLRELGTGLTVALANLTAISGSTSLGSAEVATMNALCAALALFNPAYNFCAITDPTAFTANHLKGIMSLIKEDDDIGLGGNCVGDLSVCNCP